MIENIDYIEQIDFEIESSVLSREVNVYISSLHYPINTHAQPDKDVIYTWMLQVM